MTMKKLKSIIFILSLSLLSSSALASVTLWKDFKTGMSPEEVLETLKSMDLVKISKKTPKINKYPRKPKFGTSSQYQWVPTIKSVRVKWKPKNNDFRLAGHYVTGPWFGFDQDDKLTQVSFKILGGGNTSGMISLGCYNPIKKVGDENFEFFKSALSSKYDVLAEEIVFGEGTSIVIFKNEGTRILLERNTKYQSSSESTMFKCNRVTSNVRVTYGDLERIRKLIQAQNKLENAEFNEQLNDL